MQEATQPLRGEMFYHTYKRQLPASLWGNRVPAIIVNRTQRAAAQSDTLNWLKLDSSAGIGAVAVTFQIYYNPN